MSNYLEHLKKSFDLSKRTVAIVAPEAPGLKSRDAMALCLKRIGFTVLRKYYVPEHIKPQIVVYWNKYRFPKLYKYASTNNVARLEMEHGFINRHDYSQIDHQGFMCESSWATKICTPPPTQGKERLEKLDINVVETRPKYKGYILLLGQVDNDTQLDKAELKTVKELVDIVKETVSNLPFHIDLRLRPHPRAEHVMDLGVPLSTGSLIEDLDGARFAISINSNSLNEALMFGVPSMCFGPHLGNIAGVIKQTKTNNLRENIIDLVEGWIPDNIKINSYFQWLASRQWNNDEISNPEIMFQLIEEAFRNR